MTALWIILGIIAFFALIFALPLRAILHYDPEQGFLFRIRIAFLTVADSAKAGEKKEKPKKEKQPAEKKPPEKQKKKSGGGAARALLRFFGLSDIAGAEALRSSLAEKGAVQWFADVTSAVGSILRRIGRFVRKGRFRRFDLAVVSGGGDDPAEAAGSYGTLCAAVYPLVTLLGKVFPMRRPSVDIQCDLDAPETRVTFDGELYYRPWHAVCLVFGFIGHYIRLSVRKQV